MTDVATNYDHLSDTDILALAGPYGPALIGQELFDRAQRIRKRGDDGKLGPALTDPDYAAKQAAKRAAAAPDPATPVKVPTPGTWEGLSVSGLKKYSQDHSVSYKPKATIAELIAGLEAAGIKPPAA